VKAIGQKRDQIAEHMAGTGKAVQQKQRRRVGLARFAVEDFDVVNLDRAIGDR
jgi:hypothetical protein